MIAHQVKHAGHVHPRADTRVILVDVDLLQVGAIGEKDRLGDIAEALGHPKPDIGCARYQRGIGVLRIITRQFIGGFGSQGWRGGVCPPAFGPPEDIPGQKKSASFSLARSCVIQSGTGADWAAFAARMIGA